MSGLLVQKRNAMIKNFEAVNRVLISFDGIAVTRTQVAVAKKATKAEMTAWLEIIKRNELE